MSSVIAGLAIILVLSIKSTICISSQGNVTIYNIFLNDLINSHDHTDGL